MGKAKGEIRFVLSNWRLMLLLESLSSELAPEKSHSSSLRGLSCYDFGSLGRALIESVTKLDTLNHMPTNVDGRQLKQTLSAHSKSLVRRFMRAPSDCCSQSCASLYTEFMKNSNEPRVCSSSPYWPLSKASLGNVDHFPRLSHFVVIKSP